MPDVSVIGWDANSSTSANTLTVNQHASTTTGDLVVIIGTRNGAASGDSIVDDNGATPFTKVREDFESANGSQLVIFRRVIQGGDPTSWTFDFSGDTGVTRFTLCAITFRNQHADLFDVLPSGSTITIEANDGGNLACADVNTTVNNSIHVLVGCREGADAYEGLPSGYTALLPGQFTDQPQTSVYKVIASAGATGAQTFTQSGNGAGMSQSFVIKNNTSSAAHSYPLSGKLLGLLRGKVA
jgi:hypothetical protein